MLMDKGFLQHARRVGTDMISKSNSGCPDSVGSAYMVSCIVVSWEDACCGLEIPWAWVPPAAEMSQSKETIMPSPEHFEIEACTFRCNSPSLSAATVLGVFVSSNESLSLFPDCCQGENSPQRTLFFFLQLSNIHLLFFFCFCFHPLLCHFTRPKQPFNGRPLFVAGNPQQQHPA